jgi:hypothetical protein
VFWAWFNVPRFRMTEAGREGQREQRFQKSCYWL